MGKKTAQDPFISYSYISIGLREKNALWFSYNLGYTTIPDKTDIGCDFLYGLTPYKGNKVICELNYGPNPETPTGWVYILIKNYANIVAGAAGVEIAFTIPLNYAQCI